MQGESEEKTDGLDPAFVNQLLGSLPGVNPDDPAIQEALRKAKDESDKKGDDAFNTTKTGQNTSSVSSSSSDYLSTSTDIVPLPKSLPPVSTMNEDVVIEKSNILMLGPTGTMIQILSL